MLEVEVIEVDLRLNMGSGEESGVIYKFWGWETGWFKRKGRKRKHGKG